MTIKKTVSINLTEKELLQLIIDEYIKPAPNEIVNNVAVYSYNGEYIFEITESDNSEGEEHD